LAICLLFWCSVGLGGGHKLSVAVGT